MELGTILVTDDDVGMLKLLGEVLETCGYKVITAETGAECLSQAQDNRPDLIITDINMPHVSGTTAIGMLKNNPDIADIPIIVMTANYTEENIRLAVKYKANDIVKKPFKVEDMIKRVQIFLLAKKPEEIKAIISLLEAEKEDLSTIVSAVAGTPWHAYSASHEGTPLCIILPRTAQEMTSENIDPSQAVVLARVGSKWMKVV